MPQVVKTKYGAWYLPVNLWKLRSSDEVGTKIKAASYSVSVHGFLYNVANVMNKLQSMHGQSGDRAGGGGG